MSSSRCSVLGVGKTTCLRLIAGFESPTEGTVWLHGEDVNRRAPHERDVNTVFQDYALFPHMTVAENVGLRTARAQGGARPTGGDAWERRSSSCSSPASASGAPPSCQGANVSGSPSLVRSSSGPGVLLLDEPLGALDLKLRQAMQIELKAIQQEVGISFVYVTHDQEEALTMSDRLAVFDKGRVEQVGTPAEVYEFPATEFVAGFVGVSNVLEGDVARTILGAPGAVTVRPEKIRLADPGTPAGADECAADGVVADVVYLGPHTRYLIELDAGGLLTVVEQNLATGRRR